MELQPHLILRIIATKDFTIEIFSCKSISPTRFDCLSLPLDSHDDKNFLKPPQPLFQKDHLIIYSLVKDLIGSTHCFLIID